MLMVMFNTPPGATQERTLASMQKATDYIQKQPGVESVFSVAGFSTSGSSQNSGMGFVKLKDWEERDQTAEQIAMKLTGDLSSMMRDAQVFVVTPAAIPGLGNSSGFTMHLQDLSGNGHEKLVEARQPLLALANKDSNLSNVRFNGLDDAPTFKLDLYDKKASALGLDLSDVNSTLSTVLGGTYVNDFVHNSRVKRVYVQGDVGARMLPQDIDRWQVRNSDGDMVPLSEFTKGHWSYAPQTISRFNGVEAMQITGDAGSGVSSGVAMSAISDLVGQIPGGYSYAWSGMSYQELAAGTQAWMLYAATILFVFLCLAALYESWTIPVSVMLAVPVGILGAVLATTLRGLNSDIYFQVGLLATMGLAAKNGILIVEFARELEQQGMSLLRATLQAASLRLRPIIMTSLAFMLGVLPMVLGTGAGSGARHSLGTGVLGGTLISTLLGIFFVPLFYVVIRSLFPERKNSDETIVLTEEKS